MVSLLPTLFSDIAALGGTCFYTGAAVRNTLLGLPEPTEYKVLFYGVTFEDLEVVCAKHAMVLDSKSHILAHDNRIFSFNRISGIHDLVDLTDINVNSIYINCVSGSVYDPHRAVSALKNKVLELPKEALLATPRYIFQLCRLTVELTGSFQLGVNTWFTIYDNARVVQHIDPSALREELNAILLLEKPGAVLRLLHDLRVIEFILPELSACANVIQSKRSGVRNVFDHVMYALDACEKNIALRLTILFHDIGKPQTLEVGLDSKIHFFKHEQVGRDIAKRYLKYWGYDKDTINRVTQLVLHHMFDADPRLTDKSVRRLIKKVGKEYIYDLIKIREADRLGTPDKISMKKIKLLKKKIDREIANV